MTLHGWQQVTADGRAFPSGSKFNHLAEYPQEFYLTGSRFFGTATEDSDTDFVAEDNPGLRDWLVQQNYESLSSFPGYTGKGATSAVYRHEIHNIEILLTSSLAGKLFARDVILAHFNELHRAMGKSERRDNLWDRLVRLYDETVPEPEVEVELDSIFDL